MRHAITKPVLCTPMGTKKVQVFPTLISAYVFLFLNKHTIMLLFFILSFLSLHLANDDDELLLEA